VLHVGLLAEVLRAPTALTLIGLEGLLAMVLSIGAWRALWRPAPADPRPDGSGGGGT
jgi:hypothetical protein